MSSRHTKNNIFLIVYCAVIFHSVCSRVVTAQDFASASTEPAIIRDNHGHVLGKISKLENGKLIIRDSSGHIKGVYDPVTNKTKDERGHTVGSGNILTYILLRP